jgi:Tfp pilus assembly protein PilX
MNTLLRPLTRLLEAEDGIALILAIVVVTVMTIMAVTVASLITSTQHTSSNERQGQRAFTAGDAGLVVGANAVTATWNNSPAPPSTAANEHMSGTVSGGVDGSQVSWTADYNTSAGTWTVTSTAASPDTKTHRVLQETLQQAVNPGHPVNLFNYGLVLGGTTPNTCPSSCDAQTICNGPTHSFVYGGNEEVTVPVWINGDVCVSTSSTGTPIFGNPASPAPKISVNINGSLVVQSGSGNAIGTQADPVNSVAIVGACFPSGNANAPVVQCDCNVHPTCTAYQHATNANPNPGTGVWGGTIALTLPPDQPFKPMVNFTQEYADASPGPDHPCDPALSSGTTPVFDNDTIPLNDSVSGGAGTTMSFLSWLGNTFHCETADHHVLDWNKTTGTLFVNGTVYIDGGLSMGGNDTIYWNAPAPSSPGASDGGGSIYFTGAFMMGGNSSFCAANPCSSWNPGPSSPSLFFAANNDGNMSSIGFQLQGSHTAFQGSAYTNGEYSSTGDNSGSVFADYANIQGNGSFLLTPPPQGSPIQYTPTTYSWNVQPRTWRECPSAVGCQ